jgi:tellurite resistance protein TehA-like permease
VFDESASTGRTVGAAIRRLDPAYFGLVMSTGIVSIAFHDLGREAIATPLAVLNVACFAVLLALFAVRIGFYPETRTPTCGTVTAAGAR